VTELVPVAAENEPKLKEFLAAKSVRKVLFIDDGFDLLEKMEPTGQEQNDLWTAIEADGVALGIATEGGLSGPDCLTGEMIAKLLERLDGDPLRRLAEDSSYVVDFRSKTQEIQAAIDYLKSLGLTVVTSGENDWRGQLEGVNIVFLDWRLGQEINQSDAIERAKATAKEIHKDRGPARPMIVLMSSDPSVKDHARSFSQESGLLPGLFDAMPKSWLQDCASVDLQMTVLCEHLQKGHVVQNFVDEVSRRANDAVVTLISAIQKLTLSDYANLQHFALKNEGHPLGDYLTELLAGVWVDALFQGPLREQLKALDTEDFESMPALMEPSEAVNELYNAAMFDTHVDDFGQHPQALMPEPGKATRLALALGDIVVEQEGTTVSKVYMVINPQCDLAESPRHKRRIDDDLSILLVPGELRPVGTPERTERKETADTPYFAVDGAKGRIQWDGKKQIAVPYTKMPEWLTEKTRKRKARMRPTFALALQTEVRSELARVGLPVPPPMYESIEVKMRLARMGAWNGEAKSLRLGRLLMARDSKADQLVLPHKFLTELCGFVQEGVKALASSGKNGDPEKAGKIEQALADPAELQRLAKPFPMSNSNKVTFLGEAVLVCRESKAPSNNFDRRHIVCLMLPDTETAT